MCRKGRITGVSELSRELGDRGDLVACLTSDIGGAVEHGQDVSQGDVEELEDALGEIEDLLDVVEEVGRVRSSHGDGRAGAD